MTIEEMFAQMNKNMENGFQKVNDEINGVKDEINIVKDEIKEVKEEMKEMKKMDSLILDEVERVHEIMLKRTDDLKKKIG